MAGQATQDVSMVHPLESNHPPGPRTAADSLGRMLLGGLALGLVGAAVLLVVLAFGNLQRPCDYPGTVECQFELETWREIARLEFLSAGGCALVGVGLALALRRQR